MLDTSNHVREIYVNKLNGFITFDSKNVPVYGSEPFVTPPKIYVVISQINEDAEMNNHIFINNVDVEIQIFSEQYKKNDLSIVDNISSQVLNILIPSTGIQNIGDANFEVYATKRSASRYLPIEDGQNFIARKIITISNLVNQK